MINPELEQKLTRLLSLRADRLQHRPPCSKYEDAYPWMVGGNEPDLPYLRMFNTGKFALVGCGALKAIEAAFNLIDLQNYQPAEDGYQNIPKLFIIDHSVHLESVWGWLKNLVCRYKEYEDFLDHMHSDCFFDGIVDTPRIGALNKFNRRFLKICTDNTEYQLFRGMVQKATFIRMNWLDETAMNFVKTHTNLPIAVYASNIHETLEEDPSFGNVEKLINNINYLCPIVTVYSRTSALELAENGAHISPDHIDIMFGAESVEHRQLLFQANSLLNVASIYHTSKDHQEVVARQRALIRSLRT